jgi:hypothetical protein
MTRNERVAEKMKWRLTGVGKQKRYVDSAGCVLYLSDLETPGGFLWFAKLLQARMVEDGWIIRMVTDISGISFTAEKGDLFFSSRKLNLHEEPAALVELFCKVYDIEEEA